MPGEHRYRNRDRQSIGQPRKHRDLVGDQTGRRLASWQAHQQIRAKREGLVVPAMGERLDLAITEVRCLLSNEPCDCRRVEVYLCWGNAGHCGRITLPSDVGSQRS